MKKRDPLRIFPKMVPHQCHYSARSLIIPSVCICKASDQVIWDYKDPSKFKVFSVTRIVICFTYISMSEVF